MSIDWFTFIAQILNFLVLVWLLTHFLYKPIINAMSEREKQMAMEHEKTLTAQQQAESEAENYQLKTEELAHAKDDLLADAGKEIQHWKEEHLNQARAEVDQAKTEWYRTLSRERHSFIREARLLISNHIQKMSRRILTELANVDIQQQTIDIFLKEIEKIDTQQKQRIISLLDSTKHRVLVESAFALGKTDLEKVRTFLHQFLGEELAIEFREKSELICGMELHVAGYKVAWSIQESLEELEEEFVRSLNEEMTLESETDMPTTA
ncbi:F0F1 ATP synthase subunit delta [Gimesia aquarii]|uniref:ATP synthase subunit b n=1 Tax=Gimesia aquarii TaxID=2527964 RepID=A0A517VVY7_9PLAN|nr:F0F1 ATP synthase subunit delta [Gimesia aquarii]QDT97168.1 ATP synthase subunit b [Gimesia aquarii]